MRPFSSGNNLDLAGQAALLLPIERQILLEDIGRIGLALGRDMAAGGLPVAPSGPSRDGRGAAPLERIRLLEALWPQVQAALCAMARHPDSRLHAEPVTTRPALSSGSPITAAAIARTPGGMAAWTAVQKDWPAEETPLLSDRQMRVTSSTPANRLAVTLLEAMEREAESLAALADVCGEAEEAARAGRVARAARAWRQGTFLRDLGPLSGREQVRLHAINTLRCAPAYRALLRLHRALRSPLRPEEEATALLALPSLPDWRLYEIWCFIRVAGALRKLGWRAAEGDALCWQADGLALAPVTGRASRLRFVPREESTTVHRKSRKSGVIELYYQPLFVSANRQAQAGVEVREAPGALPGYASLSHAMQPDIALRFRDRLYLLDPKFRTYSSADTDPPDDPYPFRQSSALQEDVNKMHTYRDAIVRGGKPAVAAGWCLFPGEPDPSSGPDIHAYPASTPCQPFGTAGVGAIRLRPGGKRNALESLLHHWLAGEKGRG